MEEDLIKELIDELKKMRGALQDLSTRLRFLKHPLDKIAEKEED